MASNKVRVPFNGFNEAVMEVTVKVDRQWKVRLWLFRKLVILGCRLVRLRPFIEVEETLGGRN